MNYTANHHLPQWSESDRVLMTDFNSAMSNIESGMSANASAASAAQTAASSAKTAAAAAQSTASSAQTAAAAAKTAAAAAQAKADAAYSPDNLPYVTGTYTGTGKNISVQLGFKPSFLIISGMKAAAVGGAETEFTRYFAATGGNTAVYRVQLTSFGFGVFYANNAGMTWPMLTEEGREYDYIAFR